MNVNQTRITVVRLIAFRAQGAGSSRAWEMVECVRGTEVLMTLPAGFSHPSDRLLFT